MKTVTSTQLNSMLSEAIRTQSDLSVLKSAWEIELKWFDIFMDMFLDRYLDRVSGDKKDTPEWNLYNKAFEQYCIYAQAIKSVDYFMKKETSHD